MKEENSKESQARAMSKVGTFRCRLYPVTGVASGMGCRAAVWLPLRPQEEQGSCVLL